MTDLSVRSATQDAPARTRVRFVTAASLFDGHDAAINIIRRLLQAAGVEVIHLGHNRSVEEIVTAAIEEDVHGIAVSSYQGGHVEFFRYMLDVLRERGAGHIKVFGGGGGVIVPAEIAQLHDYGVARIYSPEDGARLGLQGMIADMVELADADLTRRAPADLDTLADGSRDALAHTITALEAEVVPPSLLAALRERAQGVTRAAVLGVTGTGGSGKSSVTDELVLRFRLDQEERLDIAIIAVDPSRRRTGGALLGDRIRMNAIGGPRTYMRSLATRDTGNELAACVPDVVAACKVAGFDLIIVETPGIGQGDTGITALADVSLYVMTPEYGAASQLEKIDMLDFADFVAINKFDRRGADDALREVRKQVQRNRQAFADRPEDMPVFGTIAARFNDDGTTALYHALKSALAGHGLEAGEGALPRTDAKASSRIRSIVPAPRTRYLAEISETVRAYHARNTAQARLARERHQLAETKRMLLEGFASTAESSAEMSRIEALLSQRDAQLEPEAKALLEAWPSIRMRYAADEYVLNVRGREIRTNLAHQSLSGTRIPRVALPRFEDHGDILSWLCRENLPGHFPYTGGVFELKREDEDPTRMFAGEGDAFRTNRRFRYLSRDAKAKRLSTAFDSVTLYGFDPDERPDIYGKVGNSGVSIATLEDMKALYDGFDLTAPDTSVSMTINGPAPTILAMFLNTAIDQQLDLYARDHGGTPSPEEAARIRQRVLQTVRGTVQADILKEDQGQNTCIFSTEFALKVMGDIAQYFSTNKVRNFYSVSISGYHIAEAGANPISQLAFTLANGFTYVEAYLARGMAIDDFAPNLSFFFSNGMDPEYTVIGRVARRIWAIAMRDKYGASARSQKLKYHCQTSGRSLHAQEIDFNDIRSTLQALIAVYDNANSLHTNAFDEAITTPTEDSVRRAMAIQMIINREWGLAKNENPNQGAFVIDELTDLVEAAVLEEFDRIAERGGVLGAMELGYQRAKIQEESLYYETKKHDGSLPIVGVNTFRNPEPQEASMHLELARSTEQEKASQLARVRDFQDKNEAAARDALKRLKDVVIANGNIFEELMHTVRVASLGQITQALFEVGGRYRRNM